MVPIEQILDFALPESKTLDYKRTLNLNEKKEFCKDISSFLNAEGGQMLIGIDEDQGQPIVPISGFSFPDLDRARLQIENIIRSGISPRVQGVQVIEHEHHGIGLIEIRIPKGYDKPYQVIAQNHDKFYVRTAAGKHLMDRNEIKHMFLTTNLIVNGIKEFVEHRLEVLFNQNDRSSTRTKAATVVHIIPYGSIYDNHRVNLSKVSQQFPRLNLLSGIGNATWNNEGLIYRGGEIGEYVQIMRNGIIEAYSMKDVNNQASPERSERLIASKNFEFNILSAYSDFIEILRSLTIQLPISVNINIINSNGLKMAVGRPPYIRNPYDRSILRLVDSLINRYEDPPVQVLKPIFDSLWNTYGLPESEITKL